MKSPGPAHLSPSLPAAIAALLLAAWIVACGGGQDSQTEDPAAASSPTGQAAGDPTPRAAAQEPEEERVLTIVYWQAPTLPGPYLSGGYKDRDAGAITLEPLASYDPDGEMVPRLAEEIPTLGNGGISEDLMSITWKLRPGLMWSDGSELTAEDVVFTWLYCTDEDTGCAARDSFAGITSVAALDELTVRMEFDAPRPYPYEAFVGASGPIISRAQFEECVGTRARSCDAQNTAPLGSGPYRLTEFTPNEGAVYERNPFYRGDRPYFDRIILRGGDDAESAARAVLLTGEADYGWNLQITPEELSELEALGLGRVVTGFGGSVERIVLNQTNPDPALGDDRSEYLGGTNPHPFLTFTPIARAMSMAIDRTRIVDDLYGFAGRPACDLVVAPERYASDANRGCLVQDIEGAIALLEASGVVDSDGDGIREHEGVPLRITFQTSVNAVRHGTQQLVRDWWLQIGIETELITHDASVYFGGDPTDDAESNLLRFFADVQMYTTGPGIDPQAYLVGLGCEQIQTRENDWAGWNNSRACNETFDAELDRLERMPIGPERDELVRRMNDILVQGYYEIPLVQRGSVSAHAGSLLGVRMNDWDSELWNIAEWRR